MAKNRKKSLQLNPLPILIGLTILVLSFIVLNNIINKQHRATIEKEEAQKISEELEVEESSKQISNQMKVSLSVPTPTKAPPSCNDTQGWREYVNQKYSFCLSYSPNLILSNQSNDDFISLLERQNNGQDSILAQRLGIFIKNDQSDVSLESFAKSDPAAAGEDANPNYENTNYGGKSALVVRKNKAAQTQYGLNPEDIQQTVKAIYIKTDDSILAMYPSDSVETQKTDWLSPILQTLRFSQ